MFIGQGHQGTQLPFFTKTCTVLHETGSKVAICHIHIAHKFNMFLS